MANETYSTTNVSHAKKTTHRAMRLWVQMHRGDNPGSCGYCGRSRGNHVAHEKVRRSYVHPKWRDGWLESQYTVMVSTKRTMSATQAVCFKVPTLEVPVTSTW